MQSLFQLARLSCASLNFYSREGKRGTTFGSPSSVVSSLPLIKTKNQIKNEQKAHFTKEEMRIANIQKFWSLKEYK